MIQKQIKEFWQYFHEVQCDIQIVNAANNIVVVEKYLSSLNLKLSLVHKDLEAILKITIDNCLQLIFLDKQKRDMYQAVLLLLNEVPALENWSFKFGLEGGHDPYDPVSISIPNCIEQLTPNLVYVQIKKTYKTSKKMHLHVYLDLKQKGVQKAVLRPIVYNLLLFYLGDRLFFSNISFIKLHLRNYTKLNFMPLVEFKRLLYFNLPIN